MAESRLIFCGYSVYPQSIHKLEAIDVNVVASQKAGELDVDVDLHS